MHCRLRKGILMAFLAVGSARQPNKQLQLVRSLSSQVSSSSSSAIPSQIVNKHLWQTTGYVNGKFMPVSASKASAFDVTNPATGEVIASCPRMTVQDVDSCAVAATDAWKDFKKTTAYERAKMLTKMSELLDKYQNDLATILTLESGKPYPEAKGEIMYAKAFYDLYAEEAKRVHGEILQAPVNGRKLLTMKQPVGVAALITPWNFPAAMITRKVGPAIAAGCTVIIKPSEETPLTALALCAVAHEAGIPAGVINCMTVGRNEVVDVGTALCHSSLIRKLSFTGSTKVGKFLMRECSSTVKKISLELGGNAPFIIFDDADLDVAANAVMNSKFRNAGQTCISSNRIYVQKNVYDKFAEILLSKVSKLVCGNGLHKHSTCGPLINIQGLNKVVNHVNDSVQKGAKVLIGGSVADDLNTTGGTFYKPTILTNMNSSMMPLVEETFGPVAPLIMFENDNDVIELANKTEYGLAGYACTRSLSRAWKVAEELEFGLVGINEGAISSPNAPFGGMKESGLGREGGHYGIEEYLEVKYVCMGGL